MRKIAVWIILGALVAAALAFYVARARKSHLDVTPDARREIEKAKHR